MDYFHFQMLVFLWQAGLVDTLTVVQLFVNSGCQYLTIVGGSAVGSKPSLKVFLEPILGLGTGCQYVLAAATDAEKRRRAAILASFLASSASALTTDPNTNMAMGTAVAGKINYMRAELARGGSFQMIQQYAVNPSPRHVTMIAKAIKNECYRVEFVRNCQTSINNMFESHATHRYIQASSQQIRTVLPSAYLASSNTTISATTFIGWTVLGASIVGFLTLGALYLFQRTQRKRWQKKTNEVIIDVYNYEVE